MEFTGDEKKIQALFSELSLEQQSGAPNFEKLWQSNSPAVPRLATRFAIITASMLAAVCLLATWSWYRSSEFEQTVNIPSQIIPTKPSDLPQTQPEQFLSAHSKNLLIAHPRRLARQPRIERTTIREAAVLANWQSPTNVLLNSPVASFLSSLPQLEQSARDLEQFLPKNNDPMKESKQ